jgi:hypothetical protein
MSNRLLPDNAGAALVRLATFADEEEIVRICRMMWAENGQMKMCERKVREMLHEAFHGRGGLIGVIGVPGKIEACIFLRISQLWYSDEFHLSEYLSFVLPAYRKSRNALNLVEFAKKCAYDLGLKLFITIVSTERTEAKKRLFERRLGPAAGAVFIYDAVA